jgi:SNF2 family DNA or RNA helicase
MLRRTKREVEAELPGKTEHIIRCDMSAWQQLWYRQIAEEVSMPWSTAVYSASFVPN